MTADSTHSHSRRLAQLPAWLAAAVVLIALGGVAPPAAQAAGPASGGAATAYVGQGWG